MTEEVLGDIEFVLGASKCTLDMKTCEKYPTTNIREMCKKFQERNAFYSSALSNFKPPLKCPLKPGNYTLSESRMDLAPVAFIPLDGFVWIVTFKFVSTEKVSQNKKIVMCLNSEVKIVKTRV